MANRTVNFKVLLTPEEDAKLKDLAHDQRISKADFVRWMLFENPEAVRRFPSSPTLREIAFLLSNISSNINQSTHALNAAKQSGALTKEQFAGMHQTLRVAHKAWTEPRDDLRAQLLTLAGKSPPDAG